MLHNRSKIKTGEIISLRGYLAAVCTHTAINSLVSASVPVYISCKL